MFHRASSLLRTIQLECKPCLRSQLSRQLTTSVRKATTSRPVTSSSEAQGHSQAVKGSSRIPTGFPPTTNQTIIPPPQPLPNPSKVSPEAQNEDHTPKPLLRPLGQPNPPRPGENSDVDARTWRERRDDFFNYDKHLEKRKQLTKQISKPYFREWKNMQYHKGKTFFSNSKLFRADKALYFPNLRGTTLASPKEVKDTTPVLEGKVSVVGVFCRDWAEKQTATFIREKENPELYEVFKAAGGLAQRVHINVEEESLRAWLLKTFIPRLRKLIPLYAHGRYFMVRGGYTEELMMDIGRVNSMVGYVYLVDRECKIRWAASGIAEAGEKEGLVRGVRRLLEESREQAEKRSSKVIEEPPKLAADAAQYK